MNAKKHLSSNFLRVGWLFSDRYLQRRWSILRPFGFYDYYGSMVASTYMRVGNISKWINSHTDDIHCELFDPCIHYDVVVVVKSVSEAVQARVSDLKSVGTKIVYDANVNYWEVWGEYNEASPRPTEQQQQGAHTLARQADLVVADSSYIGQIVQKYTARVVCIPDNVDMSVYSKVRQHVQTEKLRLVWSGMSHKADHLMMLIPIFEYFKKYITLVIVSERIPSMLGKFPDLNVEYSKFSDRRYANILQSCDIIISPKRQENAYDLGHTEYKITLGMAAGLPAIASPQRSYIEAISYKGGGIIANTLSEWFAALQGLYSDLIYRSEMGIHARETVLEKYSTAVIAPQYATAIHDVMQS